MPEEHKGKVFRVPAWVAREIRLTARTAQVSETQVLRVAMIHFAQLSPELQAAVVRRFWMFAEQQSSRTEANTPNASERIVGRTLGQRLRAWLGAKTKVP